MSGAQQVVVMNQRSFVPLTYPKPVPANQYWATISRTEQTTVGAQDLSISANLFRFTSGLSPSFTIETLNQGVFISQVRSNQIGPINFQMTASGRAYVSTNFKDNSAPVTPSRIYTFDVSSGNLQSVTQFATLVYSTTGSQRFAQWWDLAVNPSRTRMGTVVKYVAADTVDRFRANVRILSGDGLGTSAVLFAQDPLNIDNFSERCIAINPVDANIVAIGGHARTNTTVGYVWVYKNYGTAQEEVDTNIFANAGNIGVFALEWSYSGEYLFASSQSITTVYKLNFDTGDVTPVFSQSLGDIYLRGIWTAEDESVILGSSNNALVRTGDNFTFVSGPGGVEIGTQPALNYNGQYLFAASQGTTQVRVFEYDGPSFFDTAVVNFNNNRYYEANGSFPMFDGKTTTTIAVPAGQVAFTEPGTFSWVAPAGVTSVSVVCIGASKYWLNTSPPPAGGGGGSGRGGGGLGWKNNISVTPGNSYTVVVADGYRVPPTDSYFISPEIVKGGSGTGVNSGGTFTGDGGGNGGNGGQPFRGGGGGAGGYSGNGGNGGTQGAGQTAGSGGGGGGGSSGFHPYKGGGGGGVGIFGQGTSGVAGTGTGQENVLGGGGGGSGGARGVRSNTGAALPSALFGGGHPGVTDIAAVSAGPGNSRGAVRIIWAGATGITRTFPSTNTLDI